MRKEQESIQVYIFNKKLYGQADFHIVGRCIRKINDNKWKIVNCGEICRGDKSSQIFCLSLESKVQITC